MLRLCWLTRRRPWRHPRLWWPSSRRDLPAVGVALPTKGRVSPVEVVMTMPSQDQPGVATVVLEGIV